MAMPTVPSFGSRLPLGELTILLPSTHAPPRPQRIPWPVMAKEFALIAIEDAGVPRPSALMATSAQPSTSLRMTRVLKTCSTGPFSATASRSQNSTLSSIANADASRNGSLSSSPVGGTAAGSFATMPSRAKIAFSLILAAATTPCSAIAAPFASAPGTAITSWRSDNPIAVRMLTAASRPSEMIARFSIATARQSCRAKTPPGPATIVPGPCPRMRTERAATIRTGSSTAYCPGPRQTVPPVSRTWFTASWMVN